MASWIKLNECYLNLDRVTDVTFDPQSGEALVLLDCLEMQGAEGEESLDQAFRTFCPHAAAILRAYLDRVAADPRTPVPEVFRDEQAH